MVNDEKNNYTRILCKLLIYGAIFLYLKTAFEILNFEDTSYQRLKCKNN